MYTKKQVKDIIKMLSDISEAKEKLCKYMRNGNGDCLQCPLNQEDRCSPLNLPEFDFEARRWMMPEE